MDSGSVLDKLEQGYYKNALPFPERPASPPILSKRVKDLTAEEIAEIIPLRAQHEHDKNEYQRVRAECCANEARLCGLFRDDVEHEFGMALHPKKEMLWQKAWERGHASGMASVYDVYADLVELVKP